MKSTTLVQIALLSIFLTVSFHSLSQQQFIQNCTMNERQILQIQPFNEDAPEAEAARDLVRSILEELNLFYLKLNNGLHVEAEAIASTILSKAEDAEAMGLNFTMFNEDFEFIEENY